MAENKVSRIKKHTVKGFDEELKKLNDYILQMVTLVKEQMRNSIISLVEHDEKQASNVIEFDLNIDKLERKVQRFTLTLMAKRQPIAVDLRTVLVSLKMSSNLERIADYATNTARRAIFLSKTPNLEPLGSILRMNQMVEHLFDDAIESYKERDIEKAMDVWKRDAEIDDTYVSFIRELLTYMMEEPRLITPYTHLLFIGRNLERIGDHTTTIAENVYFMIKGCPPSGERPKGKHWGEINNIGAYKHQ